jgi:hypothetical protein
VAGTLAGALVSGLLQHRAARFDRAEGRVEQIRRDRMDAVTALATAISDHRRAMWEVREAQLSGHSAERVRALRDESHRTRSAVTDPTVRLLLLVADESVRAAASSVVSKTYGMRDADSIGALQQSRSEAVVAHDVFVNTAGDFLSRTA